MKLNYQEIANEVVRKLDGLMLDLSGTESVVVETDSFSLVQVTGETGSIRLLFFKPDGCAMLAHVIVRFKVVSSSDRYQTYQLSYEELLALLGESEVRVVDERYSRQFVLEFCHSEIELNRAV